ncbi:MAG TPA: ABC transporter substrate-binding protein [Henriciella marina]|uniref:ABC transporter substrate-binding protein n=1 Tax=Henriciella sp. TaxID=1968823 RepID=UPI00183F9E0B|nr:ABC transporter substrate-binding protein [Henriciella sp.]HIG23233.1 ABC transporter substrate-binding protein [Henriciella sp.]HIK64111.1 ABC transporter substrate-binding protein [Henriciella marina]
MMRLAIPFLACLAAACSAPVEAPGTQPGERPMRIVSLDYCADQYVLKLADPEQILAISPGGTGSFSYMREAAKDFPTVRADAESVLVLKPDLIVRSYGGGPNAEAFFEQAGVPVLNVGWTSTIDGEGSTSIPGVIQHMADGLGHSERGEALIAEFRQRLEDVQARSGDKTALYMASGGVTSGPGSLVHEMIEAAGLRNFQEAPGWNPIPLERLTREQPDVTVPAQFSEQGGFTPDYWSASSHPIAHRLLHRGNTVTVPGSWTACGGWFLMDAIEALADSDAS